MTDERKWDKDSGTWREKNQGRNDRVIIEPASNGFVLSLYGPEGRGQQAIAHTTQEAIKVLPKLLEQL